LYLLRTYNNILPAEDAASLNMSGRVGPKTIVLNDAE